MNIIQLKINNLLYIGKLLSADKIKISEFPCSLLEVVKFSILSKENLSEVVNKILLNEVYDLKNIIHSGWLLPVFHDERLATWFGGTGLTHKSRAYIRRIMELENSQQNPQEFSDSERMYYSGLKNGKPSKGAIGAKPEWFFKGHIFDAYTHEQDLPIPPHDVGGGEEAELVAAYYIDELLKPHKIGFCLGNEFSDHILEKENHFYITQCKLRPFSIGAEILIEETPQDVALNVEIIRDNKKLWHAEVSTGEENMIHNYCNIEQHLFLNKQILMPDTIYYHFFGTSIISYADKISLKNDDIIKINSSRYFLPLVNRVKKFPNKESVYECK